MYSQFKYQTYHIFFGWWVYVRGVFGMGGYCPAGICPGVYVRGVFVLEPISYNDAELNKYILQYYMLNV